jgi:excisionase family DNA binding protein
MPQEIEGIPYLHATELAEEIGVSRQTIWRWRRVGKIPAGNRFRGRQVLFSPSEVEAVRAFAFGVEPILEDEDEEQFSLFGGGERS